MIMRKGSTLHKTWFFLALSNCHHSKSSRPPFPLIWFLCNLDLLFHKSNIRNYSKPPVPSGELSKRSIKWRFLNMINVLSPHPHRKWAGLGILSVAGWWKNIHARFEVHSCNGSRDISILKWKFRKCAKWSLFSYPVTYRHTCRLQSYLRIWDWKRAHADHSIALGHTETILRIHSARKD